MVFLRARKTAYWDVFGHPETEIYQKQSAQTLN